MQMKTQSNVSLANGQLANGRLAFDRDAFHTRDSGTVLTFPHPLHGLLGATARLLLALASALVLVMGTAWLANLPPLVVYLQALAWAGGFVFLALAVEVESPQAALLHLATGIALPVLAWLSSRVAVELIIVAAALAAVWVAAAILRR
jgi:hypothetical protein